MELPALGECKQIRSHSPVNNLLGLYVPVLATPLELLGEKP